MEFFLIKSLAFLRPVLSIDTGVSFAANINLLELAAMVFTVMIVGALGIRAAVAKDLRFSSIDFVIALFVVWCIAIYVIYPDNAKLNALAKFIIPPVTFLVAKNAIPDRESHQKVLWLLIAGASIPLVLSAALILLGGGQSSVNYWTGVVRYEGMYVGAHTMAHHAAFALMAVWLYFLLQQDAYRDAVTRKAKGVAVLLVITAVFLLYMGRVRTTLLGLFVFAAVVIAFHYRRPSLVAVPATLFSLGFFFSDSLRTRFLPELIQAEKMNGFDIADYGSGRPELWSGQLSEFFRLPIDQQLAGNGLGHFLLGADTHNDFLGVMVYTGLVGLSLFLLLQVLIFARIRHLPEISRWPFMALFAAVTSMNLVSNSYVNRVELAQMLYLVLAYIDLPRRSEPVGRAGVESRVKEASSRGRRGWAWRSGTLTERR